MGGLEGEERTTIVGYIAKGGSRAVPRGVFQQICTLRAEGVIGEAV